MKLFLSSVLLFLALISSANLFGAPKVPTKPNIIVIVADDLGYADLGCQGSEEVRTPNIDSLAKNGVRFTNGYVSCPVCSPSRAGMLTGRYQVRFGHEFNPGPPASVPKHFGLPLTEKTIADHLKAAGYVTGIIGKWHQGMTEKFHPRQRGFDEFFGFPSGSHDYFKETDKLNPIMRDMKAVKEDAYLTEAFTREAVAFIERQRSRPFFLYLSYNAVHGPLQVPQRYREKFAHIKDSDRQIFLGMLAALDDGVGAVLKKLRDAWLEQNTLIFFISDNGGPTSHNTSRNDPLRGFKGGMLEGGIRVPFIIQWKGQVPVNKTYANPVIALDILPTALAAAGEKDWQSKNLDGVNLLPYLRGENPSSPHEFLFWRYGKEQAVRQGDWKLVRETEGPFQLFNLAQDIQETNDLAKAHGAQYEKMLAAWKEWNSELVDPLWQSGSRKGSRKKE